ncbi:MAG: DUF4177 domain-containing protein [Clostridiales bacterium]|nr:DUF4177 domain-containing protein [Clostridiales bacterium]
MKEYKVVLLNKEVKLTRTKDLEQTQDAINQHVAEGWELQQVVTPDSLVGAMIGIFCREKEQA